MSREDSGVIDLFAIHNKASAAATEDVPPDIFSSPPPAFTMDITGENAALMRLGADHEDLDPFGNKPRKKKLIMMGAAAGGLRFVGILIAAFSGGSSEEKPRAAATKVEAAPPPPPVAPPPPAPTTEPPAANVPAPPTTGAVASSKPPSASRGLPGRPGPAPAAKAKFTANGGSKLTKVQSAGVAAK